MNLISCPECSTQISEHAVMCNKCSFPLNKRQTLPNKTQGLDKKRELKISFKYEYVFDFIKICIICTLLTIVVACIAGYGYYLYQKSQGTSNGIH